MPHYLRFDKSPQPPPSHSDPTLAASVEQQDDDIAQQPTQLAPTQPAEAPKAVPPQRITAQLGWAVVIAAGIAVTAVFVVIISNLGHRTSPAGPSPSPVTESELPRLLLSPEQINSAMGASGMTVTKTATSLSDDSTKVADKACLPLAGPAQSAAYADSGWTALRGQNLREPGDTERHIVGQVVVLFSSAHDAEASFTASAQGWPNCSNRHFVVTNAGQPGVDNAVGPVSNTNGTLSATLTEPGSSWTCQRALTVANNVVIDVTACSNTHSDAAVEIAHQIAAKVPG